MQLTAGQFKGIKLITPTGTRPTLSVVREAVFNILQSHLLTFNNKKFLDGFAGSSIMALEAKSRGFEITAVELNRKIASEIKENFKKLYIENALFITDFNKFIIKCEKTFDIIYLDPPWENDYENYIKNSIKKLNSEGFLIIESDKNKKWNFTEFENETIKIIKDKSYGRARVTFFQKKSNF